MSFTVYDVIACVPKGYKKQVSVNNIHKSFKARVQNCNWWEAGLLQEAGLFQEAERQQEEAQADSTQNDYT